MTVHFSQHFRKQYKRIPKTQQKKFDKQLAFLLANPRHPSLQVKRMGGLKRREARIDYHYRFSFTIEKNELLLLSIGPHDEGLGKR